MAFSRDDRIKEAVDIVKQYPGLNSFALAWVYAGGSINNNKLCGVTGSMGLSHFAGLLKFQARLFDAKKQKKVKTGESYIVSSSSLNFRGRVPVGYFPIGYDPAKAAKEASERSRAMYLRERETRDYSVNSDAVPMPDNFRNKYGL